MRFSPTRSRSNDREHGGGFSRLVGCLEGCWSANREGLRATRLTVGASKNLQMERNLTGGLLVIYQGHSANPGPFQECFSPAHEIRQEGYSRCVRVWLGSERTMERTGGTQTDAIFEKHADEMQMMTLQNATRKQKAWQQ